MMKKIIIFKLAIAAVIVGCLAIGAVYVASLLKNPNSEVTYDVSKGKVADVKQLAELCSVEIYSEVPVLDTINDKVLFGIHKQRGTISFDLEKMQVDTTGDTVRVVLSPEIVRLYESTDSNAWEVIDTKSLKPFKSGKFTAEEDNMVKSRLQAKSIRELYKNGTVSRARREACGNLQDIYGRLFRKPVKVTDPTPQGTLR